MSSPPRSGGCNSTRTPDVRDLRVSSAYRHPSPHIAALTPLELAHRIAALCSDKLASDVVVLDMRGVCDYTDFFVLATGANARQTKAVHDEVLGVLKKETRRVPRSVSGLPEATWIVADYLDVVLHVFDPETRAFYRLEDLWSDVPRLEAASA
jgi:ribosome-associated protein